jgi:hypothetical protein
MKWDLRQAGLAIVFPSLEGFNGEYRKTVCYETLAFVEYGGKTGESGNLSLIRHGYPVHRWHNPVVEGCIVRIKPSQPHPEITGTVEGGGSKSPQDDFEENSPQRSSCDGVVQSRIYLIKLAVDLDSGHLKEAVDVCGPVVLGDDETSQAQQDCASALQAKQSERPSLPAELVGYLAYERDEEHEGEDVAADGMMNFPQHETVAGTIDTYSERYGGYRELGRWYARHLQILRDGRLESVVSDHQSPQQLCATVGEGLLSNDCR